MPKAIPSARHRVAMFAALASLTTLASPVERAFGAPPIDQVTVVNPATSPALTSSIDNPGRIPYQSRLSDTNCAGQTECVFTWPKVPKGYRLVIQHISGFFEVTSSPDALLVRVISQGHVAEQDFFALAAKSGVSNTISTFNEQVLLYFDQEEAPVVVASTLGGGISTFGQFNHLVTVSGYLIDCTASACAVIAP